MPQRFATALVLGRPGDHAVVFPDFPGSGAGGDSIDQALSRAADNLSVHIEGRIASGLEMPRLSGVDEALSDVADQKPVVVARVPIDLPGKVQRVNVTIDEALLARIDKTAASIGQSRSGFLATAARARIAELKKERAVRIRKRA
jgi:predicted RNase H-like HicB family nuclease